MKDWRDVIIHNFVHIFEMFILLVLFFGGALMLAHWPNNDALRNWVIGGTVVGIIARGFSGGGGSGPTPPVGTTSPVTTVSNP